MIAFCSLVVLGCGGSSDAPANSKDNSETDTSEDATQDTDKPRITLETMEMENFEMRFYDTLESTAGGQAPTFYVQADGASSDADTGWHLVRPNATIYGDDEQNIVLKADSGMFDDKSETATLAGGVSADLSNMLMTIDSIQYDNRERVAYSDSPVHLEGDIAKLDAESIRIQPKDGSVVLTNVTGNIRLGELEP